MAKKSAARRSALGSDAFSTLIPSGDTPPAKPKRVRAQMNALFDDWYWIDWCRAAAIVLGYHQKKRIGQHEVIGPALEMFRDSLPPAHRREIEELTKGYTAERGGKPKGKG